MLSIRTPVLFTTLTLAFGLAASLSRAQTPTIGISEFSLTNQSSLGELPVQGADVLIDATTRVTNGLAGFRARLYVRQVFENGQTLETPVGLSPSAALNGDREFLFRNRSFRLARVCDPSLGCPGPTLAESITRLVRLELFATLEHGEDNEVARSPEQVIPTRAHAITGITPSSQPLNTEQRIRVTTTGTRFTELDTITLQFRRSPDSRRFVWNVAFFPGQGFPCEADLPFQGCDSRIIDDTTLEFTMKTFANPGELVFGFFPVESLLGTYDLWLEWGANRPGLHRDIISLAAWTLGDAPACPALTSAKSTKAQGSCPTQDSVEIRDPLPPVNEPLSLDDAQALKVTADYQLATTDRGELIARVFDHEFKQIGSSDPVPIDKRGSGSVQLTPLPFVIPEGTEEVALRAFLRDPAGNILAKSDFLSWKISAELSIDHIEVVQVIQTRDNTVDLIANKRTVVRVFTKSDDGRPRNDVVVELRGRRGSELGPPMRQTATSVPQPVRGEEDHSHDFVLPPSWSAVGDLLLEAVVNPDRDPPELDYSDNKKSYTARFEQTQTFDVRTIEICYECGDGTFCATGALPTPELGVQKLFPIEDSKFSIQPLVAPPLYFDSPTNRRCRGGSFGRGADPLDAVAEHILVWLLAREYWTTMAENPTRPFDQLLGWVPREVATWNAGRKPHSTFRSALRVGPKRGRYLECRPATEVRRKVSSGGC